jgi:hypothetical protein
MKDEQEEMIFLSPEEVSARYGGHINKRTLANWRVVGCGPPFMKIGKILYPRKELLEWEKSNMFLTVNQRMPPPVDVPVANIKNPGGDGAGDQPKA